MSFLVLQSVVLVTLAIVVFAANRRHVRRVRSEGIVVNRFGEVGRVGSQLETMKAAEKSALSAQSAVAQRARLFHGAVLAAERGESSESALTLHWTSAEYLAAIDTCRTSMRSSGVETGSLSDDRPQVPSGKPGRDG